MQFPMSPLFRSLLALGLVSFTGAVHAADVPLVGVDEID